MLPTQAWNLHCKSASFAKVLIFTVQLPVAPLVPVEKGDSGQGRVHRGKKWRKEFLGRWRIVCVSVCVLLAWYEGFCKVYWLWGSFISVAGTLRDADRLDDLEDGRTAHHEYEQRQQPWSHRVLFLGVLVRFGHVAAHCDIATGLLVGDADSLLGGHCVFFF